MNEPDDTAPRRIQPPERLEIDHASLPVETLNEILTKDRDTMKWWSTHKQFWPELEAYGYRKPEYTRPSRKPK